ncbi:MAG TPA: cytochrome b [Rhodocyclaceae bacterium]|nr:cytochrome b [Rhodocyclaceae bacterium]
MPSSPNPATGYSATAKSLHWLIAALIAIQFVLVALMPDIEPDTKPTTVINLHLSIGVVILVATVIRLVHRLTHPVPLAMPGAPAWERLAAYTTHLVIYGILLISPILGWAAASAHRLPVTLFGLFTLPDIAAPRAPWALEAGDIHMQLMWALLALIAAHVAAALYHHFVRRDDVLRRMLPKH